MYLSHQQSAQRAPIRRCLLHCLLAAMALQSFLKRQIGIISVYGHSTLILLSRPAGHGFCIFSRKEDATRWAAHRQLALGCSESEHTALPEGSAANCTENGGLRHCLPLWRKPRRGFREERTVANGHTTADSWPMVSKCALSETRT